VTKPSNKKTKNIPLKGSSLDNDIPSFISEDILAKRSPIEEHHLSKNKMTLENFLVDDSSSPDMTTLRANWFFGKWELLLRLNVEEFRYQPEREKIALLKATAHQQLGEHSLAELHINLAKEWGCENKLIARFLIASVHNSLGKIAVLTNEKFKAQEHFKCAVQVDNTNSDTTLAAQARTVNEIANMGLLGEATKYLESMNDTQANNKLRPSDIIANQEFITKSLAMLKQKQTAFEQGYGTSNITGASVSTVDISALVFECLSKDDFLLASDELLLGVNLTRNDKFSLCCALSEELKVTGDNVMSQHFVNTAIDYLSEDSLIKSNQRVILSKYLLALGRKNEAIALSLGLISDQKGLSDENQGALLGDINNFIAEKIKKGSHGHDLILDYLINNPEYVNKIKELKVPIFIEVGTTRENVAGQGSTLILAEYCHNNNIDFITVDMDEHNGRVANNIFRELDYSFNAVTMKGEDFLSEYEGELDFVFLDAYDFDHGNHSELRQSRYEKFLGNEIDEELCHKMHLDCAKSVSSKLSLNGLVCIDDTWKDEQGNYTAKGTTAVPYLLANGFEIFVERNRAVLMRRVSR